MVWSEGKKQLYVASLLMMNGYDLTMMTNNEEGGHGSEWWDEHRQQTFLAFTGGLVLHACHVLNSKPIWSEWIWPFFSNPFFNKCEL